MCELPYRLGERHDARWEDKRYHHVSIANSNYWFDYASLGRLSLCTLVADFDLRYGLARTGEASR